MLSVNEILSNVPALKSRRWDFYAYQSSIAGLAPGGTVTDFIAIEADADFIWMQGTYLANIAAAAFTAQTRPIPLIRLQLTDTGSGRQLSNGAVPVPNFFGTGELPNILTTPRFFARNSSIQLVYTNFDAAATYALDLAFIGVKIYN